MKTALALALLALAGCSGREAPPSNNASTGDPYGATGAPGADMTDNGAGDAANGFADTNNH